MISPTGDGERKSWQDQMQTAPYEVSQAYCVLHQKCKRQSKGSDGEQKKEKGHRSYIIPTSYDINSPGPGQKKITLSLRPVCIRERSHNLGPGPAQRCAVLLAVNPHLSSSLHKPSTRPARYTPPAPGHPKPWKNKRQIGRYTDTRAPTSPTFHVGKIKRMMHTRVR